MISVSSEIFKKWFRHIKLKFAFIFKTKFLSEYDNVIFSWDCITAVRNCKVRAKKIYYCHTPPRYIYDLHDIYVKKVPFLLRPAFKIACFLFAKLYEKDISKMDLILTNSKNTQDRIKKYLGKDSTILYPPVDLSEFKYIETKDYYFSFARLSSAKRVDRIVKAFAQMPDKKLIVSHWKNDPQKEEIMELAKNCPNIEFITFGADDKYNGKYFKEYVAESIATIYIPIDEDFWMSPVESMAAWKPVLWVNDGGLKETIIDKKTWLLIWKEAIVEDIIAWVKFLTPEKCIQMKDDCIARASEFWIDEFGKKLNEIVNK